MQKAKGSPKIKVLVVCTGNICRSPMAQQMLQQLLHAAGLQDKFELVSAGTNPQLGSALHPQTAQSMQALGFEPQPHLPQHLTKEQIEASQLVLSATIEHRGQVAQLLPSANAKNFTLLEFARLSEFLMTDEFESERKALSIAEKLQLANRLRGYAPPALQEESIVDPWGQDRDVFTEVAELTEKSAISIVTFLGEK